MRTYTLALIAAVLVGCSSAPKAPNQASADRTDALVMMLVGSFSSQQQAAADPANFMDIRLHMAPIWTSRTDGRWLYVEQATASSPDKPYRQRVYRVAREGSEYVSEVFALPGDALRFAGAWKNTSMLDTVSPKDLSPRQGCAVFLAADATGFAGGTRGEGCASDLRGAKYATSQVRVLPDRLETWDRGFDASGRQVWGATAGGYVFNRVK